MSPKIEYIKVQSEVLLNPFLSDKAKMLLGLIQGFGGKGLLMSNQQIGEVLCAHEKHIPRLLKELEKYVRIENARSRYRKIYSNSDVTVKGNLLTQKCYSNGDSTVTSTTPTVTSMLPHSNTSVTQNIRNLKELNNKTDFSFSNTEPLNPDPVQESETFEQKKRRVLKDLGFARLSEGIVE